LNELLDKKEFIGINGGVLKFSTYLIEVLPSFLDYLRSGW